MVKKGWAKMGKDKTNHYKNKIAKLKWKQAKAQAKRTNRSRKAKARRMREMNERRKREAQEREDRMVTVVSRQYNTKTGRYEEVRERKDYRELF